MLQNCQAFSEMFSMKTTLFFTFFFMTSAFAASCGQQGSIDDRIKDCNLSKGNFALITRDEKGLEIYKDVKTNLIWGDRITTDYNHYGSQKACDDDLREAELLKDIDWRLPTVHEFEVAAAHGMKPALPHMEHGFWTSTPVKSRGRRSRRSPPARVFLWDGLENRADTGDLKDGASVRCIGKEPKKS